MTHQMTFSRPAALAKLARIRALLEARPMTVRELADAVPLSKRYAQEYLNHLMSQHQVYIKRWVRDVAYSDRMYPRPVYAMGDRANAPAPKPLTSDQRKKRAWERIKADPERYVTHLLKKRKYRADVAANWMMQEAA